MLVVLILIAAPAFASGKVNRKCHNDALFNKQFNTCFHFSRENLPHYEALLHCSSLGGKIANVNDNASQEWIQNYGDQSFENDVEDYWIDIGITNCIRNCTPVSSGAFYSNWAQPPPAHALNACVVMNRRTGKWSLRYCNDPKAYVCETPLQASSCHTELQGNQECCNGCTYNEALDSCYLFISTSETWSNGEQRCNDFGGHLTSVRSNYENRFIQGLAVSEFAPSVAYYWIGANQMTGSLWQWTDMSNFTYANWASGQPIRDLWKRCAMSSRDSGFWENNFCGTARPFVCQIPSAHNICAPVKIQ